MAKKRPIWPWVLGIGAVAVGVGYWFYRKRKQSETRAAGERGAGLTLPYVPGGILPEVPGTSEGGLWEEIMRWLKEEEGAGPGTGPTPPGPPSPSPMTPKPSPVSAVRPPIPSPTAQWKVVPIELKEVKVISPPPGTKAAPVFSPRTSLEMARAGALPGEVIKAAPTQIPSGTRLIAIPTAMTPEEQKLVYHSKAGWVRVSAATNIVPVVPAHTPSSAAKAAPKPQPRPRVSIS